MESVKGLSEKEVNLSRAEYGENKLTQKEMPSFWAKYMEKFEDPIIVVLLVALGINIIFTFFGKVDWFECFGIFISVVLATLVGAISEYKNEEAFQKIQQEAQKRKCKVYRMGKLIETETQNIVVGDFVLLQSGDMIPADGVVYSGEIMVNQSALNGENKEVKKSEFRDKKIKSTEGVDFWDESSVLSGTVVCSGQCIMKVLKVGDTTVYGMLNKETQEEVRKSPLQVKLEVLAKKISVFGYAGAAVVTILCMGERIMNATGGSAAMFMQYIGDAMQVMSDAVSSLIVGITVIVVAVPEGLPLMVAIVCSINMKKMMNSNVLVRKLIGIETAGSLNILFSDKTGTITKGKLQVISFEGPEERGNSFESLGPSTQKLLFISATQNTLSRFSGEKVIGGNSTEKALLEYVKGYKGQKLYIKNIRESIFTSDKKFSSVETAGDFEGVLLKGAPERILQKCSHYYSPKGEKKRLENLHTLSKKAEEMARKSVRVIALATGEHFDEHDVPQGLCLIGLVGIRDDLRPDVKISVTEMNRAGIQTVMITGDREETAVAIATEAGIMDGKNNLVLTSEKISKMSDEELRKSLGKLRVVARALPSDKSRLVKVAQDNGMVVGMTGDGVNDLGALRRADVGFAMGSGTDVAKEAGDIVILDDNFSSIKKAVLYGRTIYRSIKKFITFQMTINIAAVSVSILGPIIGIDKPLGITQMLWINLVMDTLAAIAFGGEAALGKYMFEKPRKREEDIIDKKMWSAITVGGLFIAAMSVFMFISQDMYYSFRESSNDAIFHTGYFSYFVFSCIFNAFNARTDEIDLTEHISLNKPFLAIIFLICVVQVLMTYFGGELLGTAGLSVKEWSTVIVMALLIIPVDIFRKLIIRGR